MSSSLPVLGGAPVDLVDADGRQISIPLGQLTFNNGKVDPTGWAGWSTTTAPTKTLIQAWLDALAGRNLLRAGAASDAPPPSAIVLSARDAGSAGNTIQVTISAVTPDSGAPGNTTVDAKVEVTEVYTGLTLDTVDDVLGTSPSTGSSPGLAYVQTATSGEVPAAGPMAAAAGNTLTAIKNGGGGVVLKLKIRHTEADVSLVGGQIKDLAPAATPTSFTLVLQWSKTVAGVKLTDIDSTAAAPAGFGYVLKADPPPSGVYAPPVTGVYLLQGGADAAAAIAAKRILPSA